MAYKKYINTSDVVNMTGRSRNEIINLAKTDVLPCHKTRRGHWRFNVEAVEKYFGIQINTPIEENNIPQTQSSLIGTKNNVEEVNLKSNQDKLPLPCNNTHLVINEDHYEEIIGHICRASSSIRIMTANFKRFRLNPTNKQGRNYNDGTPFIKYLMAKAVQGVSVQIICSRPSTSFINEWEEYYKQMMNPNLFEYKFCERNHSKIIIVDDRLAYVGSANVTPAGLGQMDFTITNFEAGIVTCDPEVISSVNSFFSMMKNNSLCSKCPLSDKCKG